MLKLFKAPGLTAVFLVVSLLTFLIYRLQLLTQVHPDLGGIEFNVIYHLQSLFKGMPLYTNPELPPYSINQYGPIYYYLVFAVGKMTGVNDDAVLNLFTLSRSVSFFLNLAYAALVYLFSRSIFKSSKSASLTVAVFSFIFLEPTSFSRPDSLSHLFILSSFFCFFFWLQQSRRQFLACAAILSCVGLFTKQSAVVVPIICGLWLVVDKRYKDFLFFTLTGFATLTIALLMIHFQFGLKVYFLNTVAGVNNGLSLNWVFDFIVKPFFTSYGSLFLLLAILHQYALSHDTRPGFRFSRWLMASLFLLSSLLALKWGSWVSYYTEWWSYVLIASPLVWERLKQNAGFVHQAFQWLLPFILFVKTLIISYPLTLNAKESTRQAEWAKFQADEKLVQSIKTRLKEGEFVMLNTFQVNGFYANLLHGQILVPQFEIVLFTTYRRKVFNYDHLKKMLGSGKVKQVLMPAGPNSTGLPELDLSSFRPIDSTEYVKVLEWVPDRNQ